MIYMAWITSAKNQILYHFGETKTRVTLNEISNDIENNV